MKTLSGTVLVIILALGALTPGSILAQRGDDSERLSKNGKIQATIEGVEVTVEYGRPSVKGRKIWGTLVPYDRVWRTGADEATTLALSSDAMVEGKPITAGVYSLFTIPGEKEWTVVFNTVSEQWGAFNYDETKDALRVTVEPQTAEFAESLEFAIEDSKVVLRWGEVAVPFQISAGQ